MSKKMKRELAEIERSFETIKSANERGYKLTPLLIYYTQKRVDIADKIGRKKRCRK